MTNERLARAAQNPAQYEAACESTEQSENLTEDPENVDTLIGVGATTAAKDGEMGDEGIEHSPLALSKTAISPNVRTKSGTVDAESGDLDPDLQLVVHRWSRLAPDVRAAIMRMAKE